MTALVIHRAPRGKGLRSRAAKRRKDQTSKALRAIQATRRKQTYKEPSHDRPDA